MARPRKDDAPDLSKSLELTAGAIDRLTCPAGKTQVFLRDTKAPGLRVRATVSTKNPDGLKAFVFEAKLNRQTIRRTIGAVGSWTIDDARIEARRLAVMLDGGVDPRELERQLEAAKVARVEAERLAVAACTEAGRVAAVIVADVWAVYLAERKPHWGARHYLDHVALSKAGGVPAKRGTSGRGVTVAGPLHALMNLPLRKLDAPTIEAWAAREAKHRPTSARLAWRLLKVFMSWCVEQPDFTALVPAINPAKTKKAREVLGKPGVKKDSLMREQLTVWFDAVRQVRNPVIAAYLQTLLLIGARPGEVLALRWDEINIKWRGMTIRDKVEGERVIPLTPYVSHLLHALPRRNEWVFSSLLAADGVLTIPRKQHGDACAVAGIEGLTLHGLRRSFKSLTEWLEVPAGVVAQIMGHKPSATAEKHYTVRPLDLLRVHHEKIEAWILEQAGVPFVAGVEPGKLRVVV